MRNCHKRVGFFVVVLAVSLRMAGGKVAAAEIIDSNRFNKCLVGFNGYR